jgi:poly-beta-1,6-N-acetyl-D-glucosamine synthase
MINTILIIIFSLLLINYFIFLISILIGVKKVSADQSISATKEFISVIIPFRNESENIIANLTSLENQNYPDDQFEVIYVDDTSEDDSLNKLQKNITRKNINVITFHGDDSYIASKKKAVNYGIENSHGDIIVTTDADCIHDKNWLKAMTNTFDESTALVAGPVKFIEDTSTFSKIQSLEFTGLIITGAGLIGIGSPIICNGANLSYRKKIFKMVKGFSGNLSLSSGEDEFLMQNIYKRTKSKIKFCWNKEAVVKTNPSRSLSEFYHQRKRWASKSIFNVDFNITLKLFLIFLFYAGILAQLFLAVFVDRIFLITLIISILIKFGTEYKIIKKGDGFLFSGFSTRLFLLTENFQILYIIVASITGLFGNLKWKNRKLKR